jgi:hypothetical protein
MAVRLTKSIIINETHHVLTEIYDRQYAYFSTDKGLETLFCKQSNSCYLYDKVKSTWNKIDQTVHKDQIQSIKNQIGPIQLLKENNDDIVNLRVSGRGMTASLKGTVTIKRLKCLSGTCHQNYHQLSEAVSFVSHTLRNDEVIIESNIKINLQGAKIRSSVELDSVDESTNFPEIYLP